MAKKLYFFKKHVPAFLASELCTENRAKPLTTAENRAMMGVKSAAERVCPAEKE
jgi:hypothetical protein